MVNWLSTDTETIYSSKMTDYDNSEIPIPESLIAPASKRAMDELYNVTLTNSPFYDFESPTVQKAWSDLIQRIGCNIHIPKDTETPIYTSENPRRSVRLAAKPKVTYCTESDAIADVIQKVCTQLHCKYNDDLIDEFYDWYSSRDDWPHTRYNNLTHKYEILDITDIAKIWALKCSISIRNQIRQRKLITALNNYCLKNNIQYHYDMNNKFITWVNKNPFYKYKAPAHCVKDWILTIKKILVL
jgi:hypothetical protein